MAGVREHAERAIQIAGEHDLAYWFALGVIFRAWAMAAPGEETPESSAALQERARCSPMRFADSPTHSTRSRSMPLVRSSTS